MLASTSQIDLRVDAPLVGLERVGRERVLADGAVTLLLADVDGSTRLWETQAKEMTGG